MLCCAMIRLEMQCTVNCKGCRTIIFHTATAEAVKHEDNSPPDCRSALSIDTATPRCQFTLTSQSLLARHLFKCDE